MAIGEGNLEQSSRSPMCPLSECSSDHASTEPSPEPPPKPLRNRAWYVMAELVGTERAYVDDLQVLHEVRSSTTLTELMRDTSLNLTQDERERIALNVPEILAVHKPFAQNLEAVARDHGIVGTQTGADEGGVGDEKLAINAIALCFLDIVSRAHVSHTPSQFY
ncbi:uncharacterized protein EI90DRAFT_3038962 [Cantharellus anzutake]|uniref:uncharacterized protein n=1 Tax=Cantharellus anzutake TaxID=1750568 RepID=UPI0019042850|nr:uncharacterized protein EI90DRAFT_3038962 [Cantharellus anzutake]KAF8338750.1 hypothetical protein EI90DRAFT_3038962 [Cantharellus anzutake]